MYIRSKFKNSSRRRTWKKDMELDSPAYATLEAADVVKQPQTFDDHRGAAA